MSNETTKVAGQTANAEQTEAAVEQEGQTQAPEVESRLLAESKEYKRKYQATKAKLEELEKSKLQEQSQYKELWQKSEEKFQNLYKTLVKEKVRSAVSDKAAKAGCIDVDDLLKLGNTQLLEVNQETLEVEGVDVFVDEAKKLKPYLFMAQKTPTINTTTPGGGTLKAGVKQLKDLTKDEILAQLKSLK